MTQWRGGLCKLGNQEDDLDELVDDYGDFDDVDDWDDILDFDCSMTRDGLCGKAGSEECDWECPFRDRSC